MLGEPSEANPYPDGRIIAQLVELKKVLSNIAVMLLIVVIQLAFILHEM